MVLFLILFSGMVTGLLIEDVVSKYNLKIEELRNGGVLLFSPDEDQGEDEHLHLNVNLPVDVFERKTQPLRSSKINGP